MYQQAVAQYPEHALAGNDVQVVTSATVESCIATITMAFSADPVARWVYPDPGDFLRHFPDFVRAFGGRAFSCGSAQVSGQLGGVALWLPPGVESEKDALTALIERSVPDETKVDLYAMIDEMASFHPTEPHWYLPMIGVEPHRQNQGLGSALMAVAVTQFDAEGVTAYLESSNPRNIRLYERFGFEVVGEIRHGNSAPLFPMVRRPR